MGLLGDLFGSIVSSIDSKQNEANQWLSRSSTLARAADDIIYKFGTSDNISGSQLIELSYYVNAFRARAREASGTERDAAFRVVNRNSGIAARELRKVLDNL